MVSINMIIIKYNFYSTVTHNIAQMIITILLQGILESKKAGGIYTISHGR